MDFHKIMSTVMAVALSIAVHTATAQTAPDRHMPHPAQTGKLRFAVEDTIKAETALTHADSMTLMMPADTLQVKHKRNWATWHPNPKRALWLALVIPGAGQIYNRKYWKLPIVYGGFVGCAYAMRWNNQMYRDYSQAYMDLMDNDPNTDSYNSFMHLGTKIDERNTTRYQ